MKKKTLICSSGNWFDHQEISEEFEESASIRCIPTPSSLPPYSIEEEHPPRVAPSVPSFGTLRKPASRSAPIRLPSPHRSVSPPPPFKDRKEEIELWRAKLNAADHNNNNGTIASGKTDVIVRDPWQKFDKIATTVADFVIDAFAVHASGDFASWDKDRVEFMESAFHEVRREDNQQMMKIFEYHLIEKMKKKEFFYCGLCKRPLFNYKQALMHFMSFEHRETENWAEDWLDIEGVRRALDYFTKLPARWEEKDATIERNRTKRNFVNSKMYYQLVPAKPFLDKLASDYMRYIQSHTTMAIDSPLFFANAANIEFSKAESGRKLMDELHEHIGEEGQTVCVFCGSFTGDREGFYAHFVSYYHLKCATEQLNDEYSFHYVMLTVLINMHRRDVIEWE